MKLTKTRTATLWEVAKMSDATAAQLAKIAISARIVKKGS